MKVYSLENRPEGLVEYRKAATAFAVFMTEPFQVKTQEGVMTISPETVKDWDGGYWLVYPADGSEPYSWSDSFKRQNMVPVRPEDEKR